MSFWDKVKNLTQPYADDDEYEYEDDEPIEGFEEEEAEEQETPQERPARRRPSFFNLGSTSEEPASAPAAAPTPSAPSGFSGQVVGMGTKQEVVLFHPVNFNDTSRAADDLRSKKAVIVNMENIDKAMARRVVDFLSGCAYALDGKVKKVAQSTYLFLPHHMDFSGDVENLQTEVESYI